MLDVLMLFAGILILAYVMTEMLLGPKKPKSEKKPNTYLDENKDLRA